MQPTTQDFNNNIDYTAQNLSGNLLNNGFANLQGNITGDGQSGVVPNVWTFDTNVDIPNVPDPTSSVPASKWKHYVWYRLPYHSDTVSSGIVYTWNDNATSDPTFLKWISTAFDDTSLQNQVTTAQSNANTALNAANTANTNSSNALTQASAAVNVATNAANSVAQAESDASAAAVAATTANNTANTAIATSNGASAVAANALSIAQSSRTIANLTPGATGQRIRVNYSNAPALEYFNVRDTVTILTEQYGTGVAGLGGVAAGVQRPFNTIKSDTGGQVAIVAGGAQFVAGIYRYTIKAKCNRAAVNGSPATAIKLFETTGATIIDSNSDITITTYNSVITLDGIVNITATQIYQIIMFSSVLGVAGGLASNIAGVNEVYMTAIFERIG